MIARPIAALMVRTGDSGEHGQKRRAMEDAFSLVGVQAHFLPIVGRQRARLLPYAGRHGYPPDVVNKRRPPNRRDVGHVETAASGCVHSQHRDASRVSDEVRRDEIAKSPMAARALSIEPPSRSVCGLGSQASVSSQAEAASIAKNPGRVISEGRDNFGIERVPRTTADHRCCMLGATEHPLEGGVSGHVNDPHRQRYLVAPRTTWLTLAVPTLGDVCEQWRPRTELTPSRSVSILATSQNAAM